MIILLTDGISSDKLLLSCFSFTAVLLCLIASHRVRKLNVNKVYEGQFNLKQTGMLGVSSHSEIRQQRKPNELSSERISFV